MVLRHGDQMGNTITHHHHPGGVHYHVDFHAGGPMGSKYHGKNSWCFMGVEFLPQTPWDRNTMGGLHGFSWVPNFYLKSHGDFYKGLIK
jgi:hypothetical protein